MTQRSAAGLHPSPDDDQNGGSTATMGFLDHLEELRKRLIRSCIAVGVGMIVAWYFIDRIADFVLAQIVRTLPPGSELIYTNPADGFSFWFNLALIAGIGLAAPFVMYQVWGFIAPGLYAHEKKFVIPFVALTAIGTAAGALFSNYLLFPGMMKFFGTFSTTKVRMLPSINDTFDHYILMMLGMIAVFQMPTLVYFLARFRLVTAGFLWRNFKYAILIIFIAAALLTASPDWWNQTAFALPMIGLYLISIGIAWIVGPTDEQAVYTPWRTAKLALLLMASHLQWADADRKRRPRLVHPQR
jgi:sec-independent protein translocase protein TatC